MTVLSLKNIGKSFRSYRSEWHRIARWFGIPFKPMQDSWVLRNIGFDVNAGDSIGIVGQNGAGKSTLLKIITHTLIPTEGSILVKGRVAAILELGMGFNPDFTGRQNVRYSAGLMGFSVGQIEACMPEIEAFSGIGEYFDEPLRTYSSGMQVRVAFAVATAWRPDILIIDEALSVGDAYFGAKCYQRINHFKKEGTTLLLVSHSVEEVAKHCDRAIFLNKGQIKMDGPSREVINFYLDELFRKSNDLQEIDLSIASSIAQELPCDSIDRFHTRPGYRSEEYRWGHGGAVILDYLVVADEKKYPAYIQGDTNTDFYFKVRFNSDYDSVVPGFLIKTLEGIFVYATNSFLCSRGKTYVAVQAGDVKTFRFSLRMTLVAGYYLVSFGISAGDPQGNPIPLDRRYDSLMVNVERTMGFGGLVNLDASFQQLDSEIVRHH